MGNLNTQHIEHEWLSMILTGLQWVERHSPLPQAPVTWAGFLTGCQFFNHKQGSSVLAILF